MLSVYILYTSEKVRVVYCYEHSIVIILFMANMIQIGLQRYFPAEFSCSSNQTPVLIKVLRF